MRFYDLARVQAVIDMLEAGRMPTAEDLAAARAALDREREILVARSERSQRNFERARIRKMYQYAP